MAAPKYNLYTCFWLMYLMTSGRCHYIEAACSKFPYEEALLEKLVRLEFKVEQMDSGIRAVQEDVIEELNKLKKEIEESLAFRKQLEDEIRENSNKTQELVLNRGESVIDGIQQNSILLNKAFQDMAIEQSLSLEKLRAIDDASNIHFRARDVSNLTPMQHEPLVFTNVMSNQGEGYNASTGIFTAPRAGLYLFSTQLCIPSNRFFYFAVYVDGFIEQPTTIGSSKADCITSVMPIELRNSSEVRIKCAYGGDRLYTDSKRWNIFSGMLIRPV